MTAQKKLIPLSFSVKDFLFNYSGNLALANNSFASIPVIGKTNFSLQLVFQDLDSNHATVRFEQSLDNINFDDIVDASGNTLLIPLLMTDKSISVNIFNLNTAYIRFTLYFSNLTTGSLTYYSYLTT